MKIKVALGKHWVSCILLLGWRGKLNGICSMNVLFRNLLGHFKIMEILTDIGALVHFTQIIYLFILFFFPINVGSLVSDDSITLEGYLVANITADGVITPHGLQCKPHNLVLILI